MLQIWVNKIRTNDPEQVASLYHDDGLLLGTFSDIERKGYELILAYFENLLKSKVDVEIINNLFFRCQLGNQCLVLLQQPVHRLRFFGFRRLASFFMLTKTRL